MGHLHLARFFDKVVFVIFLGSVILAACIAERPSPDGDTDATAVALVENHLTQTAAAITPAPSHTPSPTITTTPTRTPTTTLTPTPTPTSTPEGGGGVILFSSLTFGELGREDNIQQRLYMIEPEGSGLDIFRLHGREARWWRGENLLAYLDRGSIEYDGFGRIPPHVLRVLDLATNEEVFTVELTEYERLKHLIDYFEWLPDGGILFSLICRDITYIDDIPYPNCPAFYRLLPDRSTIESVDFGGLHPTDLAISPDGRSIAIVSAHEGEADIYVGTLFGDDLSNNTNSSLIESQPAWSPEGTRIAFSAPADEVAQDIYVLDLVSGETTAIVSDGRCNSDPAWSPDGTMLVYRSGRNSLGIFSCLSSFSDVDLYVVSIDGGDPRLLTDNLASDFSPVWLPADAAAALIPEDRSGETDQNGEKAPQINLKAPPLERLVAELEVAGYIETTGGTYQLLPDYVDEWAQLGWYQWEPLGLDLADFVLSANMQWDVASETADWWSTGCGIVFRESGVSNNYLALYTLQVGDLYFSRTVNGTYASLGDGGLGWPIRPFEKLSGQRQVVLVANGAEFYFFIDGILVHERTDQGISSGDLGFATLSGTNAGFGTRCTWTEIELYELNPSEDP